MVIKSKLKKAGMAILAAPLVYGIGWLAVNGQKANPSNHANANTNLETRVESVKEAEANEHNGLNYVVKECALEETPNDKEQDIDYKRLYEIIARHEGIRNNVYLDTKGIKTIGAGFNLEKTGAKERVKSLGLDYNDVCSGKKRLSDNEIYIMTREDVETAISDAKNYVGENWHELNPKAKEVIIDMAYNMGGPRLNNFKKLKEALRKQDYQTAAYEMENSKWYLQTKSRAKEDIAIMKSINP